MATILNPYISFKDTAREAMEFYKSVFGGELTLSTFGEFKGTEVAQDPAEDDKIMHGMLVTAGGITIMGADTPAHMEYHDGARISVSLSGENEEELNGYYEKLAADGGAVTLPLEKAPWGDWFGMCVDKFGINWMVNINAPKE